MIRISENLKNLPYTLILLVFAGFINTLEAQIINIPDSTFKNILLHAYTVDFNNDLVADAIADTNGNGEIELGEAQSIITLDIRRGGIRSLAGIEHFTNIKNLRAEQNAFTNINLSALTKLENFDCNYSLDLTTLNVQGCAHLINLAVYRTALTRLDVSNLTNLQFLSCSETALQTLNVRGCTNLVMLDCRQTFIFDLNLSNLPNFSSLDARSAQLRSLNVQGCNNLQQILCEGSKLQTLKVTNLPKLFELQLNSNQLTSLTVDNCPELYRINCAINRLTNLSVHNCSTLHQIDCMWNKLTALDLQNLLRLTVFNAHYNEFEHLDMRDFNLSVLNASHNKLLDINIPASLVSLGCNNNKLKTLNLQAQTRFSVLYCEYNLLESLFINNNAREPTLEFKGNSRLSYICCDTMQITDIRNKITAFDIPNCTIGSFCPDVNDTGLPFTLKGNSYYNTLNVCDSLSAPFANLKYSITNSTNNGFFLSNANGQYTVPLQIGNYTIKPALSTPNYFQISPDSLQIALPAATNPIVQNFCIAANGLHRDLEVAILPITPARPGFDAIYKIIYKNKGTVTLSDTVSLHYEANKMSLVNANIPPQNVYNDKLSWRFTNLKPFENRSVLLTFRINKPTDNPPVNVNDLLVLKATIQDITTDETPQDNITILRQTTVGAIDPNDKTCLEGDEITIAQIGNYLHYLIRFENTGSFAATNIVVQDVIDLAKFNIKTLEIVAASHECQTQISGNNQVEFVFKNINLPFTAPDKYGFVAFKIKTLRTLLLGNAIQNHADIYFDYNLPIVTNTATTTIVKHLPETKNSQDFAKLTISPNPAFSRIDFNTNTVIEYVNIFDILGRLVQTNQITNNTLDITALQSGIYFITLYSEEGVISKKLIKN